MEQSQCGPSASHTSSPRTHRTASSLCIMGKEGRAVVTPGMLYSLATPLFTHGAAEARLQGSSLATMTLRKHPDS